MNRWNRPAPPARRGSNGATPAAPPFSDLYARWAHASQWRGFRRGQPSADTDPEHGFVRIIAKARNPAALKRALNDTQRLDIPEMYAHAPPGATALPLHFTARLLVKDLAQLASTHPGLRWELAAPLREAETLSQADTSGRFGPTRLEASLRAPPLPRAATKAVPPAQPLKAAIGVIDFGCPFLNPRFATADHQGRTRVAALWDQDPRLPSQVPGGPPPEDPDDRWWHNKPAGAGYGRVLDATALTALHALTQGPAPISEAAVYRRIDYLLAYDDPRRRLWTATHGAHVLDMAGGRPDPLAAQRQRAATAARPPSDPAASAPLLFVQLPALTAADSSGGSLSACLLDALRYLLAQCADTAPLVANISYGTFAGPHDGSSLIESAMDELLALRRRNFAIVLGAGNGRQAGCHLQRTVRPQRSALLRMMLQPGDTTDTFVEIWYPRPTPDLAAYTAAPPLGVRVRTAGRDWSEWAYPGQACTLSDPSTGELVALLQHADADAVAVADADAVAAADVAPATAPTSATNKPSAGQTVQQVLVLLALAPTAHAVDDEGPLAEAGGWEIEVAFKDAPNPPADAAVTFNAWVERDDPGDTGQGAQPRFFGNDRDDENNTLSSIATGQHTVVVGGYRLSSGAPAAYSALPAAAASARALPLVYGPCEEDEDQQNLPGCAVRTGEVYRMNGTSVAAPVLARQLFNAMVAAGSRGIGRNDWPAVLQTLADDPASLVKLPAPP